MRSLKQHRGHNYNPIGYGNKYNFSFVMFEIVSEEGLLLPAKSDLH